MADNSSDDNSHREQIQLSGGSKALYELAAGHFAWLASRVSTAEEGAALVAEMTRTVDEIRQSIERRFARGDGARDGGDEGGRR